MASCTHGNGRAVCFECFRAGMERTRARQAAWTQRELPFDREQKQRLTEQEIAHRKTMLAHLVSAARGA